MGKVVKVIGGLGIVLAAVLVGAGPGSAQQCGGYAGPPCEEVLEFQYPATVTAGGPIAIEGSIRGEEAQGSRADGQVEFEIADRVIGSAAIRGDGTFPGTFTVPDIAAGTYTIRGTGGGYVAEGPITVVVASTPSGGGGADLDCQDIPGTTILTDGDPNGLDADGDGIGCDEDLTTARDGSTPLARTGLDATPMITLGAAALLLGAAAVYGSRRRRLA